MEYWKEDTLCRFLSLAESIRAGPVLYQMCTYLGAFPFPALAPCILTREAMLKVVTIMTGRYKRVLKRGNHDKIKLLFRSLAVFDKRASESFASAKHAVLDTLAEQKPEEMLEEEAIAKGEHPRRLGFAIDDPANDDEDEDDDDLALAALDSLDAIEVFKHDQRTNRKISHAMIPLDNFKRLVMLLLLLGNVGPQSSLASYAEGLGEKELKDLDESATAIIAAFDPDPNANGIRYSNFVKAMTLTFPDLFEPFNSLFEHFLFSKNINLSKHKNLPNVTTFMEIPKSSPIYKSEDDDKSSFVFTDTILSQLSTSIRIITPASSLLNIYQSGARFNHLYSTTSHGTSLSSFSRQVISWKSATILIASGNLPNRQQIVIGAYLPGTWRDSSSASSTSSSSSQGKATMFQLKPRHAVFPENPYNKTSSVSHFSNKTGIALGCVIPQQSRTHAAPQPPIPGPVSLVIDSDISTATFQHDGTAGSGVFVTDPGLEEAQRDHVAGAGTYTQPKKVEFDLDSLEVWGISFPEDGGDDEVTKQKKRLAWEEAEAARRRGVNFGGDKDGARALLEMAGLVGDKAGNRSGGSV